MKNRFNEERKRKNYDNEICANLAYTGFKAKNKESRYCNLSYNGFHKERRNKNDIN